MESLTNFINEALNKSEFLDIIDINMMMLENWIIWIVIMMI